jgi:hypothetical protein
VRSVTSSPSLFGRRAREPCQRKSNVSKVCDARVTYSDYLERRAYSISLLVHDERPILHFTCGEKANIAASRQLLRCASRVVVSRNNTANGADNVEMVSYEGFIGDEEEEAEVLEDGDLCHLEVGDYLTALLDLNLTLI